MTPDYPNYPTGHRVEHDGQLYIVVGSRPYVRQTDGVLSAIYTLRTACPDAGCGALFEFDCGPGLLVEPRRFPRRCSPHRAPLRRVNPKARGSRLTSKKD